MTSYLDYDGLETLVDEIKAYADEGGATRMVQCCFAGMGIPNAWRGEWDVFASLSATSYKYAVTPFDATVWGDPFGELSNTGCYIELTEGGVYEVDARVELAGDGTGEVEYGIGVVLDGVLVGSGAAYEDADAHAHVCTGRVAVQAEAGQTVALVYMLDGAAVDPLTMSGSGVDIEASIVTTAYEPNENETYMQTDRAPLTRWTVRRLADADAETAAVALAGVSHSDSDSSGGGTAE